MKNLSDSEKQIIMECGNYIIAAACAYARKRDLLDNKTMFIAVIEAMRLALLVISEELESQIMNEIEEEDRAKGRHDEVHTDGAEGGMRASARDLQDGGNQATEGPDRE